MFCTVVHTVQPLWRILGQKWKVTFIASFIYFHSKAICIYESRWQIFSCPFCLSDVHPNCRQSKTNPICGWIKSPDILSLPPAVVCICPVGFGHLVKVLFAFHYISFISEGGQQLLREFLVHVCATVLIVSAFCDQPLHGQKTPPIIRERDGHLQHQ